MDVLSIIFLLCSIIARSVINDNELSYWHHEAKILWCVMFSGGIFCALIYFYNSIIENGIYIKNIIE